MVNGTLDFVWVDRDNSTIWVENEHGMCPANPTDEIKLMDDA